MDKLFLIIVIVFTLTGIFAYDQSFKAKGEVSPISRLIDFGGLAQLGESSSSRSLKRHQEFHSDMQANLARLSQIHQQIEAKRLELVENRRDILKKLAALNTDVQKEADGYVQLINQEKTKLQEQFPELEQFGSDLAALTTTTDPQLRQTKFNELKQKILNLLNRVVENSTQNVPKINAVLDQIEMIIQQGPEVPIPDCDDAQRCLKKRVGNIEQELSQYLDQIMSGPTQDLSKLLELTQTLQNEYQTQVNSTEVNQKKWKESDQHIEGEMKRLVEELVAVTDKDIKDLMNLYQELKFEQDNLTTEVEFNRKHLTEIQQRFNEQLRDVLRNLKDARRVNMDRLVTVCNHFGLESDRLLQENSSNTDQLLKVIHKDSTINKTLVEKMAQSLDIDINRLMEDNQYRQEVINTYMKTQADLRRKLAQMNAQRKLEREEQQKKQKDVEDKLRDLREKNHAQ